MEERPVAPPAHDRHPPESASGGAPPDPERRPVGALAVSGFLVVTILVVWFGMYFLNIVRN